LRNALRQLVIKLIPDLDATALKGLIDELITEANAISGAHRDIESNRLRKPGPDLSRH
jgi:hypothetical protein